MRLDLSGLGLRPVAGSCEHGNKHLVSNQNGESLD
jgi:hypothetical protein